MADEHAVHVMVTKGELVEPQLIRVKILVQPKPEPRVIHVRVSSSRD